MRLHLTVVQGRPMGKSLTFRPGEYILGRGQECHIRFNTDWVSRQHCQLHITDESAAIRDLGSRNGTILNGKLLVGEQKLTQGDRIQIGAIIFEVQLECGSTPWSALSPSEWIRSEEATGAAADFNSTASYPPMQLPKE